MEQTTRWQRSSCSSSSSSFSSTLSSWQPSWQPPQTWRRSQVTYFFEAETELLCPANYALFPFNIHSCEVAVSIRICLFLRLCFVFVFSFVVVRFSSLRGLCEVVVRFCLFKGKISWHQTLKVGSWTKSTDVLMFLPDKAMENKVPTVNKNKNLRNCLNIACHCPQRWWRTSQSSTTPWPSTTFPQSQPGDRAFWSFDTLYTQKKWPNDRWNQKAWFLKGTESWTLMLSFQSSA